MNTPPAPAATPTSNHPRRPTFQNPSHFPKLSLHPPPPPAFSPHPTPSPTSLSHISHSLRSSTNPCRISPSPNSATILRTSLSLLHGRRIKSKTKPATRMDPHSVMPDPPRFSHERWRLPTRADVGFPHASEEEVAEKMGEVRRETEWEECSPRICCLTSTVFTGGDGGNAGGDVCGEEGRMHKEIFLDRPVGMDYFMACPLDLRGVLPGEQLFCTMALYCFEESDFGCQDQNYDGRNPFLGKISEDFFFPAGDWGEDGDEQPWRRRKRRAVFSYDPFEVRRDHLFLVVQVFCTGRYVREEGLEKKEKKTIAMKMRSFRKLSKGVHDPSVHVDFARLNIHSHGHSRTQFLTPVSFSIARAFPSDKSTDAQLQWPKGETTRVPFYSYPDAPDSQEEFINRLSCLSRYLRTPKLIPSDQIVDSAMPATASGHLDIFSSFLGGDFTRSLMNEPSELYDIAEVDAPTMRTQLLADVMGECAISYDDTTVNSAKKQRAGLRKLPPSLESGYTSSFDIKEVLYFPPRFSPRKYDEDAGLTVCSYLNLLYIYPRLIRVSGSSTRENGSTLSLQVRVVEQDLHHDPSVDGAEAVFEPLQSIYNPLSPAGPPLVEAFHTKLVSGRVKQGESKIARQEIPLNDEVKIRLPNILDRRHFLQFSLISINFGTFDNTAGPNPVVAETTVPFIISSKEPTSGGRVTTIIPNGLHRIQLSELFQIHVETRLMSSYHISDPSVATILRDYPLANLSTEQSSSEAALHRPNTPFLDILTTASGHSIRRHFHSLMTVNMIGLINQRCPGFYFETLFDMFGCEAPWHRLVPWENIDPMISTIRSLFEILEKSRVCFSERDRSTISVKYEQLLTSFVNCFDESLYALKIRESGGSESENLDQFSETKMDDSFGSCISFSTDHNGKVNFLQLPESTSSMNRRKSYISMYRSPKNELRDVPFKRKAFVATRIDQMKAEVDLDIGSDYFDDDETVATFSTLASRVDHVSGFADFIEAKRSFASTKNNVQSIDSPTTNVAVHADYNTPQKTSPQNVSRSYSSTPFSFATKRAEYMANRVNSMAQLVMAPCMAPSLSEAVSGSNTTPENGRGTSKHSPNNDVSNSSGRNGIEPGSDDEEEGNAKNFISLRGKQSYLKLPPLIFHLITETPLTYRECTTSKTSYLYELIFALWVQSWSSYAASLESANPVQGSSATVPAWPFEVLHGTSNPSPDEVVAFSFIKHIPFFLPMALKSLSFRCLKISTTKLIVPMTFLDDSHMQIICPMMETIALGTMREALSGSNGVSNSDHTLAKALVTTRYALDFLSGLFTLIHPSQVSSLVDAYFQVLEECGNLNTRVSGESVPIDKQCLRRVNCSRILRIRAVERLAVIPRFVALNYPPKYTGFCPKNNTTTSSSWLRQNLTNSPPSTIFEKNDRYPQSFWLSELLMNQCLSICLDSCATMIAEARAHSKSSRQGNKTLSSITQTDLLRIESIAYQAILCAYETLIKRHAMDSRFQSAESNTRVAAMFASSVLQNSASGLSVLSKLESNQKIRAHWVLCILYVLQEAPEVILRDALRLFCQEGKIVQFVTLLTISCSTLQHLMVPASKVFDVLDAKTKELAQEGFNCMSATVILVVDECADLLAANTENVHGLAKSVFDVLLHLLVTPQSSVTLLRTLGGSVYAFDKFGASTFLRVIGGTLQHWCRIALTLLNSTELSVRSMAVELVVSILGGIYNEFGNIDEICLVLLTVLPEVIAREIALSHVSDLIGTMGDAEVSLWPMRRAFADIEDTNPADDDRVDPQLIPSILTLCRTGQAIMDGVLVEIRLKGSHPIDLHKISTAQHHGLKVSPTEAPSNDRSIFDADEESILEAATFFPPQSSLPQRLRWLFTLRDLHVSKSQWAEAAETLVLCAHSIIESFSHILQIWRPSRFDLWNDFQRSPWLSSIGIGENELQVTNNDLVMSFSNSFLEPAGLLHDSVRYLSVDVMCATLLEIIEEAFHAFGKEDGLIELAYGHLEKLLSKVTLMISNQDRSLRFQDIASVRRVRASICAKLAELDTSISHDETRNQSGLLDLGGQRYVRVILRGNKPERFKESTTIPTYFEWNEPSICRVPQHILERVRQKMSNDPMRNEDDILCSTFAEGYISALRGDGTTDPVILRIDASSEDVGPDETRTYLDVMTVQMKQSTRAPGNKFFLRNGGLVVEFTVAHTFPHVVSRQRTLVTSEIKLARAGSI